MYSSGTTAIATSGAGNVTLVTVPAGGMYNRLVIVNTGTVAGFFSLDGGNTWGYISAGNATVAGGAEWYGKASSSVVMKRLGGSDMTGVFAYVEWVDF